MSARATSAAREQTVRENRARTLPRARLATLPEPQPRRPHRRRLPQPATITGNTTAAPPQARMDSTGNGNATYPRTLHAGGKQGGQRKRTAEGRLSGESRRKARDWLRADAGKVCAVLSTWSPAPPRPAAAPRGVALQPSSRTALVIPWVSEPRVQRTPEFTRHQRLPPPHPAVSLSAACLLL